MKISKIVKKMLPEVHILGDLDDVKQLVSAVNKKKAIVIFRNPEEDNQYLEIDGKFKELHEDDLRILEKDYKIIIFSFFPSLKNNASADKGTDETAGEAKQAKKEKKERKTKGEKKEKKGKAGKQKKVEN